LDRWRYLWVRRWSWLDVPPAALALKLVVERSGGLGLRSTISSLLATPSSPPPARTQIWPTMHLLTLERVGCRITVISWWIVGRSITINDALITRHQFPTARVPRWKRRADHGLCACRRCAAQHCRSHRQSQNQPLHLKPPNRPFLDTLDRFPFR